MKPLLAPELEAYAYDHTTVASPILDELRDVTYAEAKDPEMQIGRVEGALLKLLLGLVGAKRVLEIGTFTGYSALAMAAALPDDGELVTLDRDPVATAVARSFFDRAPQGKRIRLVLGDALETLRAMPAVPSFDAAFIDADKERYSAYYEEVVPRVRVGGLVIADNTLWSGTVVAPLTDSARAIAAFNDRVHADPRVENVLLTVRDGLIVARRVA